MAVQQSSTHIAVYKVKKKLFQREDVYYRERERTSYTLLPYNTMGHQCSTHTGAPSGSGLKPTTTIYYAGVHSRDD